MTRHQNAKRAPLGRRLKGLNKIGRLFSWIAEGQTSGALCKG